MTILQPGTGNIPGRQYLETTTDTALWGWIPTAKNTAVAAMNSGETITVDTLSHEGLLADQGSDPQRYFRSFGAHEVLQDAVDFTAGLTREPGAGPHVVTGPISVKGATPGDLLCVEFLQFDYRVPYGIISNRHGFGALEGEFPEQEGPVSLFSWVEQRHGHDVGLLQAGNNPLVQFPLFPFLGLVGTAPDVTESLQSSPPGEFGGNMDIKHLTAGSKAYLPVAIPGAHFFLGDPHFAQGNGEVALTALEASLRATVRVSVIPASETAMVVGGARGPVGETHTHWIPSGMDHDLNIAMRNATRNALNFLHQRFGVPKDVALAYLSAAADFEISQVVDGVKGVHCMIAKSDWRSWV